MTLNNFTVSFLDNILFIMRRRKVSIVQEGSPPFRSVCMHEIFRRSGMIWNVRIVGAFHISFGLRNWLFLLNLLRCDWPIVKIWDMVRYGWYCVHIWLGQWISISLIAEGVSWWNFDRYIVLEDQCRHWMPTWFPGPHYGESQLWPTHLSPDSMPLRWICYYGIQVC